MARVIITRSLEKRIDKTFKKDSVKVFELISSLESNPKKGKVIGAIGEVIIKELRYKGYRIYFIADRYKIKFLQAEELHNLLIKFVRMSDKKSQKSTIDEIKHVLALTGFESFY